MVLSHSRILMMINGDICEYFDDGGDGVEGYEVDDEERSFFYDANNYFRRLGPGRPSAGGP